MTRVTECYKLVNNCLVISLTTLNESTSSLAGLGVMYPSAEFLNRDVFAEFCREAVEVKIGKLVLRIGAAMELNKAWFELIEEENIGNMFIRDPLLLREVELGSRSAFLEVNSVEVTGNTGLYTGMNVGLVSIGIAGVTSFSFVIINTEKINIIITADLVLLCDFSVTYLREIYF